MASADGMAQPGKDEKKHPRMAGKPVPYSKDDSWATFLAKLYATRGASIGEARRAANLYTSPARIAALQKMQDKSKKSQ